MLKSASFFFSLSGCSPKARGQVWFGESNLLGLSLFKLLCLYSVFENCFFLLNQWLSFHTFLPKPFNHCYATTLDDNNGRSNFIFEIDVKNLSFLKNYPSVLWKSRHSFSSVKNLNFNKIPHMALKYFCNKTQLYWCIHQIIHKIPSIIIHAFTAAHWPDQLGCVMVKHHFLFSISSYNLIQIL